MFFDFVGENNSPIVPHIKTYYNEDLENYITKK